MNKKIAYLIFLLLILTGITVGFLYRDSIMRLYNNTAENIDLFKKTDLANSINEVVKQIFAPGPLNTGGGENNAVLISSKIIAQTNMQRFDNGMLSPLVENAQLNAAALVKANDILKLQYFEHVSPNGVDPGTLVKNAGYDYIVSGENLILGNFKDEAEVVQKWMDSPGHRANILNNRFSEIGVAIIKGTYKGQTVWVGVQEFGLPFSACDSPNENIKTEIENNKITLDQLSATIDAKRKEVDNANKNSPQYNQKVDEYNALVNQYNQLAQATKNLIAQYNNQVNSFNKCVAGN